MLGSPPVPIFPIPPYINALTVLSSIYNNSNNNNKGEGTLLTSINI